MESGYDCLILSHVIDPQVWDWVSQRGPSKKHPGSHGHRF